MSLADGNPPRHGMRTMRRTLENARRGAQKRGQGFPVSRERQRPIAGKRSTADQRPVTKEPADHDHLTRHRTSRRDEEVPPGGSGGVHTAVRELDPVRAARRVRRGGRARPAAASPPRCPWSPGWNRRRRASARRGVSRCTAFPRASATCSRTTPCMPWRSVLDNVAAGPRYRGASKARPARRPGTGWTGSGWPGSRTTTRTSCPAACASASRWPQTLVNEPVDPADGRAVLRARRADPRRSCRTSCCGCGRAPARRSIFVTHDLDEAIALADKVVVMTASPATVKDVFDVPLARPREGRGDAADAGVPSSCTARSGNRCAARSTRPARREPPVLLDLARTVPGAGDRRADHRAAARRELAQPAQCLVAAAGDRGGLAGQLGAGRHACWIDPFFYSKPSLIWHRLVEWFTVGTDRVDLGAAR